MRDHLVALVITGFGKHCLSYVNDSDKEHLGWFIDFACIFSEICLCGSHLSWEIYLNEEALELFGRIWTPNEVRNLINRSLTKWSVVRGSSCDA